MSQRITRHAVAFVLAIAMTALTLSGLDGLAHVDAMAPLSAQSPVQTQTVVVVGHRAARG